MSCLSFVVKNIPLQQTITWKSVLLTKDVKIWKQKESKLHLLLEAIRSEMTDMKNNILVLLLHPELHV